MSSTRTDSTVVDLATQVDINTLLADATADVQPRVNIPPALVTYLNGERGKFAANTNRFRRTLNVNSDALAMGILANRPADRKLAGSKLREAAAKEFCRQLRQYADDNQMSAATDRDAATVTYRLAKRQPAKTASPVTVTQVAAAAETSKSGAMAETAAAASAAK